MSVFDVRGNGVGEIDKIMFSGNEIDRLSKDPYGGIKIEDEYSDYSIDIPKEDIPNLIKALQKAVELGWAGTVKKPVTRAVAKKAVATVKKAVVKK